MDYVWKIKQRKGIPFFGGAFRTPSKKNLLNILKTQAEESA